MPRPNKAPNKTMLLHDEVLVLCEEHEKKLRGEGHELKFLRWTNCDCDDCHIEWLAQNSNPSGPHHY